MKYTFPKQSLVTRSLMVGLAFSVLASIVAASYIGQQHSAGTVTSYHYDKDGNLVGTEDTYDDKGRLTEKKEYKNRKLRKRTTYSYLNGFKEPNTSTTDYEPDGKTPQKTTNEDHDKDGNPTITTTSDYDKDGKETGGTKRVHDPNTGKDSCYKWDPKKQEYQEVPCPPEAAQSSQPPAKPSPRIDFKITDRDTRNNTCVCGPEKNPCPCPSPSPTPASGNSQSARVETGRGLQTVIFDTSQGNVRVYLPNDMMAGDTISGTVVAEPKGQTDEERAKNMSALSGYVIDLATPKKVDGTSDLKVSTPVTATPSPITFTLPPLNPALRNVSSSNSGGLGITLTNTGGSLTIGPTQTVPIEMVSLSLQSVQPITVQLPTIGQQGKPIEIIGPFDGNSQNTTLNWTKLRSAVQDFEKNTENISGGFGLIAESPRKCVLTAPTNFTGPVEITLKEGNKETKGTYRNIGVNLSAPKTNLLKGESTTLTIQVSGLQGIKEPVPLTLESHGVIAMEGGMFQPLMIQPSQVGPDGRYTTTRGITGVQTGGWTSTATVVTQPFNIVLRDPDPPQTILINSFTGDYTFCGSSFKLSGTGQIKRQGCVNELTDNKPDRQVQGKFNSCVPVDNGRFSIFYSPGTTINIDTTVTDTQPPKRRVYFNPPTRPAPPVQDVSAFATCP